MVRIRELRRTLRATKLIAKPRSTRLPLNSARDELVRIKAGSRHAIECLGRARRFDRVVGMAIFLLFSNSRLSISHIQAAHLRGEGGVGTRLNEASLEALVLGYPIASSNGGR